MAAKSKQSVQTNCEGTRHILAAVMSGVGGQGKTLVAEMTSLQVRANSSNWRVYSADIQARLAVKLGKDRVRMIDVDLLDAATEDPLALVRAFSEFTTAVAEAGVSHESIVLDTAAGADSHILRLFSELQLDKLVATSGGKMFIVFVVSSNLDAIHAMVESTSFALEALPDAQIVWALNNRFGPVLRDNLAFSPVENARLVQLRSKVLEFEIARLDDRIWQPIDQAGLNMVDFVRKTPAISAGSGAMVRESRLTRFLRQWCSGGSRHGSRRIWRPWRMPWAFPACRTVTEARLIRARTDRFVRAAIAEMSRRTTASLLRDPPLCLQLLTRAERVRLVNECIRRRRVNGFFERKLRSCGRFLDRCLR